MNILLPGPPGVKRPHGSIPVRKGVSRICRPLPSPFLAPRTIKILNFLVFQYKKNRPAPWAVKIFFFQGSTNRTVFKGVGLLFAFQGFGSGLVGHLLVSLLE